jgi:hypothetical protein
VTRRGWRGRGKITVMTSGRSYRAGESIEDYCRACKIDRMHTVMAADHYGVPIRVVCSYCRSEHNYRGGPRMGTGGSERPAASSFRPAGSSAPPAPARHPAPAAGSPPTSPMTPRPPHSPHPGLVTDRERSFPAVSVPNSTTDLELMLRRVIREETGMTPVAPAEKWRDGSLVLRSGRPGVQEKSWPLETFFHKIVMLRNRLRTLEQQLNASDLPEDVKVKLQSYVTGCYGSLTSFNVLFADEEDQFKGSGGE